MCWQWAIIPQSNVSRLETYPPPSICACRCFDDFVQRHSKFYPMDSCRGHTGKHPLLTCWLIIIGGHFPDLPGTRGRLPLPSPRPLGLSRRQSQSRPGDQWWSPASQWSGLEREAVARCQNLGSHFLTMIAICIFSDVAQYIWIDYHKNVMTDKRVCTMGTIRPSTSSALSSFIVSKSKLINRALMWSWQSLTYQDTYGSEDQARTYYKETITSCWFILAPMQPPITKGSFPKTPQPTSGTTMTSASKTWSSQQVTSVILTERDLGQNDANCIAAYSSPESQENAASDMRFIRVHHVDIIHILYIYTYIYIMIIYI